MNFEECRNKIKRPKQLDTCDRRNNKKKKINVKFLEVMLGDDSQNITKSLPSTV